MGEELKQLNPDDPAARDASVKRLRQLLTDGRVPDDLRRDIEDAYDHLAPDDAPDPGVAVRSSATAEDTAQFSFASMFESRLNVAGKPQLIDAVKRCGVDVRRASAVLSPKAASSRSRHPRVRFPSERSSPWILPRRACPRRRWPRSSCRSRRAVRRACLAVPWRPDGAGRSDRSLPRALRAHRTRRTRARAVRSDSARLDPDEGPARRDLIRPHRAA